MAAVVRLRARQGHRPGLEPSSAIQPPPPASAAARALKRREIVNSPMGVLYARFGAVSPPVMTSQVGRYLLLEGP